MKTFAIRFYLVSIVAAVLVLQFFWFDLMATYTVEVSDHTFQPEKGGASLVTQLLFPVLLMIGTTSHFLSRKIKNTQN